MNASTTGNLVSSSDVSGTAVYGIDGKKIGSIDHLMIDKPSGKVAYAVMGFGGFLGMGQDQHPVPWSKLRYDTGLGGFMTDITEQQVTGAPAATDNWFEDRDWEQRSHDHYGADLYWR